MISGKEKKMRTNFFYVAIVVATHYRHMSQICRTEGNHTLTTHVLAVTPCLFVFLPLS